MTKNLLTFKDVATAAGVTRKTLYAWERSGRFAVKPFDNRTPRRWHSADIDTWLKPESCDTVAAIFEA